MKSVRISLFLLAFLLFALSAKATQESGVLVAYQTAGAVHLRWNAPASGSYQGFVVERRESGEGAWRPLSDAPVRMVTDVDAIRRLLGPTADLYLGLFGKPSGRIESGALRELMEDEVAGGFLRMLAVRNPMIAEVLGTVFHDFDLQRGKAFDYRVRILEPGGARVWAATARPVRHGEPDRLPVPSGLRGKGGDASALLDWDTDPALSRSGVQVGFRIYRSDRPAGPFEPVTFETVIPVKIDGRRPDHLFVDSGLENGRPYWYRITGVNVLGFESPPTEAIKVVPRDDTPPPAPEGLAARLLDGDVLLRWRPVAVEDLEGYRVYRAMEASGPWKRVFPGKEGDPLLPRITYRDRDVPEGAQFWYQVTAVDVSGNESRPSRAVQVFRPDVTPPAQVQGLRATAQDKGPEKGIVLTWKPNREKDLLGYLVERTTGIEGHGGKTRATGRFFALHADPLEATRYVDPVPVRSESRYAYRVIAVDRSWNRSEPSKVVVARMPDKVPPEAPNLVRLEQVPEGVRLRWTPNVEEDLAGYRIERARDGGAFQTLRVDRKKEALPPEVREYLDRNVRVGHRYRYRLVAIDASGNRSRPSQALAIRMLDLEAPAAPAIRQILQKAEGLEIRWKPNRDRDVKRQLLYRKRAEGEPVILAELKPDADRYLDREVEVGTTYTYFLRVADAVDNVSDPGKARSAKHRPRRGK